MGFDADKGLEAAQMRIVKPTQENVGISAD
jgi:hypothetical protein